VVLSLNNKNISNVFTPAEVLVKSTIDSPNSFLPDLYLENDINGTSTTKLYDKRDDFNFPIVNYPFLDSNIPSIFESL